MREGPDISRLAALIGDPGRAAMLVALMGGQALTAAELAAEAGVTAQTASGHLSRLSDAGLLTVRKQGRHKYFALASAEVAAVVEGLMGLADSHGLTRTRPGPRDEGMREARVCYNHLAGRRGVQMYDSLAGRGFLEVGAEGLVLSQAGRVFAGGLGVDVEALETARTPVCRECLDWSERRSHLAGSLGRAIFARMERGGWIRRDAESRAVVFSRSGLREFEAAFPV